MRIKTTTDSVATGQPSQQSLDVEATINIRNFTNE